MLTMALAALVTLMATAAAPSTYYNNAKNKSDKALMTALHQIIKGHTKRSYQQLWSDFKTTDCVGSTIIDRYSTTNYTYGNQCGSGGYSGVGDCYNREHSIPNSWWGGSDTDTAYTDLHHMFPVDGWVNNERGNHPFGDCANGTPKGTGKLGSCTFTGYNGTVFEVADEYKGDFARVYFYFATRYMPRIGNFTSSSGYVVFSASSYKGLTTWAINQLLEWHRNDPVSTLETTRNDAVYGIQHNRNPFVDNPELVEYIWGNMQGQVWGSGTTTPVLTAPTNGSTVNLGTHSGTGVSKTITVSGSNLTKALTVTVSGTGFSVTPSSITATAANNGTTVTVSYTGTASNATGTLTFSSSEVSATVNLTASYSSGSGGGGTETIETWEDCTGYGNYANKSVQGKAFTWYFSNAGIFAQSNDHWNGTQGCRFGQNSDSYIEMMQDVTDGASKLTFYACKYGNDAAPTMQVQYSTNGGSSWSTIATLSPNSTWQQYSYNLNLTGNVRFKFVQTAGARLNIDDIAITSNSSVPATPVLTAPTEGSTINVGTIQANASSVSKTITVKGENLTKQLNLSTTGTGFTVSPSYVSAANANAGTTVTVTYASTVAGNATGTLIINSSEVDVTVNLTANKIASPVISISTIDAITAEQDGASSIVSGTVIAQNNSNTITLSVTGNFELSRNRINWANSISLSATGETFYVRIANTGTVAEFNGTITATTGVVSAYADVTGSVTAKPAVYGDVNMDNELNMDDLTTMINYLLNGSASPFDYDAAASLDGMDGVAMGDLAVLINLLLNGQASTLAAWTAVPVDGGIMIENPMGEKLEVYNFDAEVIAVVNGDKTLNLPAGIYLVSGKHASQEVVIQ